MGGAFAPTSVQALTNTIIKRNGIQRFIVYLLLSVCLAQTGVSVMGACNGGI